MMSTTSIISNDLDPYLEQNLIGHKKSIYGLTFNPSGHQLASCSADKSVMLWHLRNKNVRCYNFKGHTDVVTNVEFSTNGQLLASSSQDRTVRLWLPTLKGGSTDFIAHTSAVRTVTFSPNNEQLLTGSNDKSMKLWNVQFKRFLSSFLGHTNWVRCARFSPDGKIIGSCADDRTLRVWDVSSNQCIHTFTPSKGKGNCISFHGNGDSVALALSTGSIRVYDIRNNKLQQHYTLHDNATCVTWHPHGQYFMSGGLDGTIKIVDALEGRPMYTLKAHDDGIHCVTCSLDGEYLASTGDDKHIMNMSDDTTCRIEAPVKANIDVTTEEKGQIDVSNFNGDKIFLRSGEGRISASKCHCNEIVLFSLFGDVICPGVLQAAKIRIKTQKNGMVSTDKLQGIDLTVVTENGDIQTESCYCTKSAFLTETGNVNLKYAHKTCSINIKKNGRLIMTGFDGTLDAFVNKGSADIQLSRILGKSKITIEGKGLLNLKVSESCLENNFFDIKAKDVQIGGDVNKNNININRLTNSNEEDVIINAREGKVNLQMASLMDMFNLVASTKAIKNQ